MVDPRTGHSYPHDYTVRNGDELQRVPPARRTAPDPKRIKKTKDPTCMEDITPDTVAVPDWLDQALRVSCASLILLHLTELDFRLMTHMP